MTQIPPCCVCGKSEEVICYPDPPEKTYCPEHCPDHDFEYERSERKYFCKICGMEAPYDDYYAYDDC